MNFNKIQSDIIKEVFKKNNTGKTELRLCKEFEFESITFQPILFSSHSVTFIPSVYYYLDNEKIGKCLKTELFDVSKIKIERGQQAQYKGINEKGLHIFTDGEKDFYFNKEYTKYIDKYDNTFYYIDTTKTFLLCYDLYDRPLVYIMRIKQ